MDEAPPMMSTPKSSKYSTFPGILHSYHLSSLTIPHLDSSFLWDITQLPSKLFNDFSPSNTYDLDGMESNPSTSFNKTMCRLFSSCRHSLRLLSNGYYVVDDSSVLYNEDGSVIISPTKPNVSYKENSVRIFRKRRKQLTLRKLEIDNMECKESDSDSEDDNWDPQRGDYNFSREIMPVTSYPLGVLLDPMEDSVTADETQDSLSHFSSEEFLSINNESDKQKTWIGKAALFSLFFLLLLCARFLMAGHAGLLTALLLLVIIYFALPQTRITEAQSNQNVHEENVIHRR
ncbi:transmembrane protein 71 [Pelobates fuscus]|uniref:transmembrane protein 71 n=1 Tax=Pelobates fuscus TaxID=191477 RepID=UPI002FE4F82A